MVDPDDMSAASDEEMSNLGGDEEDDDGDMPQGSDEEGMGNGAGLDSDEEDARDDDDDHAPPGGREEAGDEEEEDDDAIPEPDPDPDDEEAQEHSEPQPVAEESSKKTKTPATGIMKHFQVKQNQEKAGSSKNPEASKAPAATSRGKGGKAAAAAAAAAQPVALGSKSGTAKGTKAKGQERPSKAAAASAPAKKTKEPAKSTEFSFHDSEEEVEITMPQNKGVPLAAPPDVEQELEDFSKGGASASSASARAEDGGAPDPPPVSEMAKKRRYVLKNEKTKRWAEWLPKGLLYAPECDDVFELGMEDLTIQSKKDRLAAQHKLVDEQMSKLMQTLLIGSLTTDSTGSGSGPGMTNLMAGIPSELPLHDKELDDLMERMRKREPIADGVEVVLLHVLDHEIVKRVFKVNNAPLPALYNPNTNASNKYKVPNQLEKVKEFDDNFVEFGLIEKAKQRAAKRSAEERPNGGGGKADGKRPATSATNGVPGEIPGKEGVGPGEYSDTLFKGFHDEEHAISYAKLTCKENEVFTVLKCSNGKWLLLKSIE